MDRLSARVDDVARLRVARAPVRAYAYTHTRADFAREELASGPRVYVACAVSPARGKYCTLSAVSVADSPPSALLKVSSSVSLTRTTCCSVLAVRTVPCASQITPVVDSLTNLPHTAPPSSPIQVGPKFARAERRDATRRDDSSWYGFGPRVVARLERTRFENALDFEGSIAISREQRRPIYSALRPSSTVASNSASRAKRTETFPTKKFHGDTRVSYYIHTHKLLCVFLDSF